MRHTQRAYLEHNFFLVLLICFEDLTVVHCCRLRLKQNKYPVVFLTQGVTKKYPPYRDPRTQNIPMAVRYANSAGILVSKVLESVFTFENSISVMYVLICSCWLVSHTLKDGLASVNPRQVWNPFLIWGHP
jgi:hypothetical protein